jgi:hypothetical protein
MVKHAEIMDEEEHFVDIDEDQDEVEPSHNGENWKNEEGFNAGQDELNPADRINHYDARKRDPKFALAEGSCLWELVSLGRIHIHAERSGKIVSRLCLGLLSFLTPTFL